MHTETKYHEVGDLPFYIKNHQICTFDQPLLLAD